MGGPQTERDATPIDGDDLRALALRRDIIATLGDLPSGHLSLAAWKRVAKLLEREINAERVSEGLAPGFRIASAHARGNA
jgi:hypothetical protein